MQEDSRGRVGPCHLLHWSPPLQTAAAIFGPDLDMLSVKAVMRKLSRGVVRRGRASTKLGMVAPGAKGSLKPSKKGACAPQLP